QFDGTGGKCLSILRFALDASCAACIMWPTMTPQSEPISMKRRQSIRRSRLARHLPQSEPLESRVLLSSTLESDLLSQPADTPVAAAVLATTESIYLSDLTPTTAVSPHLGWKRDRSAGGSAMRIGGAAYD